MITKLKDFLKIKGIEYVLHTHPAVFTVEQSKNVPEINNIKGLRSKNLFLKDDKENFYLICLNGLKRLNRKKLKKELNIKDFYFASALELKEKLNLSPGSVSIFGMIYSKDVKLIIDKELFDSSIVSFHPNINTASLEITHSNLMKFISSLKIKPLIIDITDE